MAKCRLQTPADGNDVSEIDSLGPVDVSTRDVYMVRLYHNFKAFRTYRRSDTYARTQQKSCIRPLFRPSETWVALVEKASPTAWQLYRDSPFRHRGDRNAPDSARHTRFVPVASAGNCRPQQTAVSGSHSKEANTTSHPARAGRDS